MGEDGVLGHVGEKLHGIACFHGWAYSWAPPCGPPGPTYGQKSNSLYTCKVNVVNICWVSVSVVFLRYMHYFDCYTVERPAKGGVGLLFMYIVKTAFKALI
mgnify:CR=1 FL=1